MNTILFDLDGTLIDSFEGIYSCYKKGIKNFNIEPVERREFRSKIGASFDNMLYKIHPEISDHNLLQDIVKIFRLNYDEQGYKQYVIFDNICRLFELLNKHNWKIGIVSNKKNWQVEEIVLKEFSAFKIGCYGKVSGEWTKVKQTKELQAKCNIIAFVGDTQEDYDCAKAVAKKFIYASYGYGEVKKCNDYEICRTTAEIYESIERTILSCQMEF